MLTKMSLKNFKLLKDIFIPFILSTSIMFGIEYILLSIIENDYIQHRHSSLPTILIYANIIIGLLTVTFVLYANRFVMKQRKQAFALNMVLGLEKKHLRFILLVETVIQYIVISVLSITGGYLFGNLVFLLLNKLVKEKGIVLMKYPFDFQAASVVMIGLAVILLFLLILNNITITRQSPVQLMRTKKAGEKKTNKWVIIILFIIGALALSYGYYIALTAQGVISSILKIFIAVLAVMIGTYCLFMSFTIIVLQGLRRNANIYYKSKNFFSISGLLSRMKSNAVGLASIAMLVTFLMVTLGMTVTAYRGIEAQIKGAMDSDYGVTVDEYEGAQVMPKTLKKIQQDVNKIGKAEHYQLSSGSFIQMYLDGKKLVPTKGPNQGQKLENVIFSAITTEKDFNASLNQSEQVRLKQNEIAISANTKRYRSFKKLTFNQKSVNVINIEKDYLGSKLAVDGMFIIVKDESMMLEALDYYSTLNGKKHKQAVSSTLEFDIAGDKKAFNKKLPNIEKKYDVVFQKQSEVEKNLYELNGGLIFMGIVVSIVLLTGIFLILYYKQLSEGYEDKQNYSIMKKVGLSNHLIKQTIHKQIFWIFGLPLMVSLIHLGFASKIIYNVLGILGVRDISMFITSYMGVGFVIMLVYGLMYWITSNKYYSIINQSK